MNGNLTFVVCHKRHAKSLYCQEKVENTTLGARKLTLIGEQGWCSGESTRLPPMWPGFDSRTLRHMWVEFVGGSLLATRGFSPGTPFFPSPQ